jgi:hypothetical protein
MAVGGNQRPAFLQEQLQWWAAQAPADRRCHSCCVTQLQLASRPSGDVKFAAICSHGHVFCVDCADQLIRARDNPALFFNGVQVDWDDSCPVHDGVQVGAYQSLAAVWHHWQPHVVLLVPVWVVRENVIVERRFVP